MGRLFHWLLQRRRPDGLKQPDRRREDLIGPHIHPVQDWVAPFLNAIPLIGEKKVPNSAFQRIRWRLR